MYERILHPTDGSEGSAAAADHAIDLAKQYDATLHSVYAVNANVGPEAGVVGVFEALEGAGQEAIDAFESRAASAGIESVEGAVVDGRPLQVILDYVDDHDVDLVVMGTHGRTGIDRYLLGSVAEKVVRRCPVPVLTVRSPVEAD